MNPEIGKKYRICSRCIMDTTDPDITFNAEGICNHCLQYDDLVRRYLSAPGEARQRLEGIVKKVSESGKNRPYDCIIGVSGGVDSTYLAHVVKELGLRPLAVHLDNGWDSELAVKNIERVLKVLGIDLYTYVIDWEEFRDLQISFLKASTPDGEVPSDHAIVATLYRVAAEHNIKYIILGTNIASESVLPVGWAYGHADYRYIREVWKRFGSRRPKTFPRYGLLKLFSYRFIRGITLIPLLNYVRYEREEAMALLEKKLGWIYYGGKHYESVYTRFYQAYVLPRKFDIDKRKAHLSSLICSGQMTREKALEEMKKDIAPPDQLAGDREYVIKKFGLSENEFEAIMALSPKTFLDYPNNYRLIRWIQKMLRAVSGRS